MTKHKFEVEFSGYVTIEIDDAVFKAVDDDWRKTFYNLRTPEQIAEHIAFAMTIRGFKFSQLDGFGGLPDDAVRIDDGEWECDTEEVK